MRPLPKTVVTVAAAISLAAGPTPAHASSDACTHHWAGPKICVRVEGHSVWVKRLTAEWVNPPADVQSPTAYAWLNGRLQMPKQGHRQGGRIVAFWGPFQHSGTVCVGFAGSKRRACQDVYDNTRV